MDKIAVEMERFKRQIIVLAREMDLVVTNSTDELVYHQHLLIGNESTLFIVPWVRSGNFALNEQDFFANRNKRFTFAKVKFSVVDAQYVYHSLKIWGTISGEVINTDFNKFARYAESNRYSGACRIVPNRWVENHII